MKRVQKRTAKKLFEKGSNIYLLPCKCKLGTLMYENGMQVSNENESFDSLVNSFEYYNCNNETGLYTHFYVEGDAK